MNQWEFYRGFSDAIDQARRDDPEYDKAWRDGLQRMADEWDRKMADKIYREILGPQRTGDEPV